ncbi:MAG: hypothetical protein QE271_03430 [Bacteriovoracaceae bacterium]|nr:hypothetical protein [Bacteriovoracaceae bacterium]
MKTKLTFLMISIMNLIHSVPSLANEYRPLCVDLGRRMVQEKMTAYYKLNKMIDRNIANNKNSFDFKSLPSVVSKNLDFSIAKILVQNNKDQLKAQNFDQKMELEEKLILRIQKQLASQEGEKFLNSCENLYVAASKHCAQKFGAKTPSKNAQCVQQYVGVQSPFLQKIVPFATFASKMRKRI